MNNSNQKTIIFTDGSSRGNPGPGGWGAIVIEARSKEKGVNATEAVIELGGGEKNTTNNRMELTAALEGLKKASKDGHILVYTDSRYVINGITKWIHAWKKNGWKTKAKKDVLNSDIWEKLDKAVSDIELSDGKIEWKYIGGHIGILGNERCDHIATAFADGRKIDLYKGPLGAYDLPDILNVSHDEAIATKKKSSSSHSNAKAYSYVSMVGGIIEVHHSWPECEKRVKGAKGAKYKKSINLEDEQGIVDEFGAF
jgi:ribonuclease HI